MWHFNQQVQREYPVLCALSLVPLSRTFGAVYSPAIQRIIWRDACRICALLIALSDLLLNLSHCCNTYRYVVCKSSCFRTIYGSVIVQFIRISSFIISQASLEFDFVCFHLLSPSFCAFWGDANSNASTRMVLRKETHHLFSAVRIHACCLRALCTPLPFCLSAIV